MAASSRSRSSGMGMLAEDLAEEPADDQPPGDVLRDAAALQVEQLLVVEAPGRAGVPGAGDLAGLDLQVRHRVGPRACGEHEVAVELEGVGVLRRVADQHVADPDRVRPVALQGVLVEHARPAVRHRVVDEQALLQVLAGVGVAEAHQLRVAARPAERDRRADPHQVAAERHRGHASAWRRGPATRCWAPTCTASSAHSSVTTSVSRDPSASTTSRLSASAPDPTG